MYVFTHENYLNKDQQINRIDSFASFHSFLDQPILNEREKSWIGRLTNEIIEIEQLSPKFDFSFCFLNLPFK